MKNTFMEKLFLICGFAETTAKAIAEGHLTEGTVENNQRIMRLRYMDALIDLARERFARNFADAIEGFVGTGLTAGRNTPEKIFHVKAYLEKNGMKIEMFMFPATVQSYIIYELCDCDPIVGTDLEEELFIPYIPDWVIYGMEELFWRLDNDSFVGVDYFDEGKYLVPTYSSMDKETAWNQFALFILGMLDGGTYIPAPEYNHEWDVSEEEEETPKDTGDDSKPETKRSCTKRFAETMAGILRKRIKL